jgi:hypothetical protein
VWLVSWLDTRVTTGRPWRALYSRIDAKGTRLDPLNGRPLAGAVVAPLLAAAPYGWLAAYGVPSLMLTRIGFDGAAAAGTPMQPGLSPFEAITAMPLPLIAYTRAHDPHAYLSSLAQHRRATSR